MPPVEGSPVQNPYSYGGNDPLNQIDPLGLRPHDDDFGLTLIADGGPVSAFADAFQQGNQILCPEGFVLYAGDPGGSGSIDGPEDVRCVHDSIDSATERCLVSGDFCDTSQVDDAIEALLFDVTIALVAIDIASEIAGFQDFFIYSGPSSRPRTAADIDVEQRLPTPTPASVATGAVGRLSHQNAAQAFVQQLNRNGARDVRVNQWQTNARGVRVGRNRPDVQGTLNGQRVYFEIEGVEMTRALDHAARILANDPDGLVVIVVVP